MIFFLEELTGIVKTVTSEQPAESALWRGLQIIFFSISNKFAEQKGVNHSFELIFCPGTSSQRRVGNINPGPALEEPKRVARF